MTNANLPDEFCQLGLAVLETEARAISDLQSRIDENFSKACQTMLNCNGRIVVIGMGKSGHIGHKIAATLASTGSPAFFVHPGEANHGDMGMITDKDVVLAISNSGSTQEIISLLPLIKRLGIPLIALTGNPTSPMAMAANIHLDVSVAQEACPLGLAPTASTTAALVMGDALAIALLQTRGFTADDFARSHPGGQLGRRLLLHINDIMHGEEELPTVTETATVSKALIEMTQKKLGMTCVCDAQNRLVGIFTDGDLRRALDQNIDIHTTPVVNVMSCNTKTIEPSVLAIDAIQIMETHKITALVVCKDDKIPLGVIHFHDLLNARVL